MPNWCENELYVTGKREDLDRFKQRLAGENGMLDANQVIPYPIQFRNQDQILKICIEEQFGEETLKEEHPSVTCLKHREVLPCDGYNSGGQEWCCENWGTKWNFHEPVLVTETDESLHYEFLTAWSPPLPLIVMMGELFPTLHFALRYFECGLEFNGIILIKEGKVVRDECGPYFGHRGG